MLIAFASDAHGNRDNISALVHSLPDIDAFCYLGDCQDDAMHLEQSLGYEKPRAAFFAVRGNCDFFSTLPDRHVLLLENTRTLLTHGHLFHVKTRMDLLPQGAAKQDCTLVLFGHTHRPFDQTASGVRMVNPGALTDGYYGLADISKDGTVSISLCRLEQP